MELTSNGGGKEGCHGVGPGHLLQDGDEESNLNLRRMLQKTVKSGCALGFGENLEPCISSQSTTSTILTPRSNSKRDIMISGAWGVKGMHMGNQLTLLDGTQFFLKIDVKRGSSHFFLYRVQIPH